MRKMLGLMLGKCIRKDYGITVGYMFVLSVGTTIYRVKE